MSSRPIQFRDMARWATGLVASAVLMYMAFLSLQEGVSLRTDVIVGLLALIIILLYGVDSLVDLIDAWRGDGGQGGDGDG